nr:cytochrome c-type biogenesis protein [Pseudomaricurvus sp. HS19]
MVGSGLLLLLTLWSLPAAAVIDNYEFDDEVTRQRYLSFIEEMRCPKCQNQNLAGSDSPIAADLRRELYLLLEDGKSDKEIIDFMVARYGDYVLYRPPVKSSTVLLWALPATLLLLGVGVVGLTLRSRARQKMAADVLSSDEQTRLRGLLEKAEQRRRESPSGGAGDDL